MERKPTARYTIGNITTKDVELWKRAKDLSSSGETMESIFRRGVDATEKELVQKG